MNDIVTVIEIGASAIKVVTGYKFEREVIVQFASTKKLRSNTVIDSIVHDDDDVSKTIRELILEAENTLKSDIKDVTLVLPAVGLEVFGNMRMTPVLSTNNKISETDIRNVIATIFRDKYPTTNEVIDVLPIVYILDNNREYSNPPIGEESTMLNLRAYVHTIPQDIVRSYRMLVENAGLKVKSLVAAPYGVAQMFSSYKEIPEEYFLINIGAKTTSVTTISNGVPFKSCYFSGGGESITTAIQSRLGINYEKAEEIKRIYGLDPLKYDFVAPIAISDNGNVKFTVKDLNPIVEDELNRLLKDIVRALKILSDDVTFEKLPVVFIGGGSRLIGIKDFMQKNIENRDVIFPMIKSVGARNMTYIDVLGGIKVTSNVVMEENKQEAPTALTRETSKKPKYSETNDDL
ncbi:MAG: hypothetical protein J1F32_04225 [Erysipelotrichales bacterium]|nr:hypothetical protein [Erysipelotrichales bacterium]